MNIHGLLFLCMTLSHGAPQGDIQSSTSTSSSVCKDKSSLCSHFNKETDCKNGDIRIQCPRLCNLCSGTGSCKNWAKNGFKCVKENVCGEDGHFDTQTMQAAIGVRHDGDNFNQFQEAREADCQKSTETCCRKSTFFMADFIKQADFHVRTAPQPINRTCGLRNQAVSVRISAGAGIEQANFGEWPNMCLILRKLINPVSGEEEVYYQAGASLIAPNIVLTAAHQVQGLKPNETIVRCGEFNAATLDEEKPHQEWVAKYISVHPAFNEGGSNVQNLHYNYALVHTVTNFDYDDHIHPVCLPNQLSQFDSVASYKDGGCYAMGYGQDKFGFEGTFSSTLKIASMSSVNFKECDNEYRDQVGNLHHSFTCFQGLGSGTCTGDGGGPLVCPLDIDSEMYMQVGVAAWGDETCDGSKPDVFSDVSKGLGFIDYAARCVEGTDTDLFGMVGNERWAKRQYCNNKKEIENIRESLQTSDDSNSGELRHKWFTLRRMNKKFEEAIKNCATGKKDLDCSKKDYISSKEDFEAFVDSDHTMEEDDLVVQYDAFVRSDFNLEL